MRQTGSEQKQPDERSGRHEGEEVAIISPANTVVEPDAMMILRLNAIVTDTAMMGSRGTPDVTCLAVLRWHLHGGSGTRVGPDRRPSSGRRAQGQRIIALGCWREGVEVPWKDTRIGCRSVNEGRHANEEDICEEDGYRQGNIATEPGCAL